MWDDVRGLQQMSLPCQPIYSSQPFPTAGCEWICLLTPRGCRTGAPPHNPAPRWLLPSAVNSQTSLCPVTSTSLLAMQEAVPPLLALQLAGVLLPLVLCRFLLKHQEFCGRGGTQHPCPCFWAQHSSSGTWVLLIPKRVVTVISHRAAEGSNEGC